MGRWVVLSLLLAVSASAPVAAHAATGPTGTLTVAYATLFDENLNPLLGPAPSKVFFDVMYEYLLYNDPQTLKAEPGLAERWSMSQDGKRWIFFLRKDVTFSDGTEFTAEDVKFSLELFERKESRWPLRATFLRVEPKVLDRHTIAFDSREGGLADLDQTFSYFLGLPIVSKAHYDKVGDRGYEEHPLGTGPYRFKARRAGDSVSFEARPDWKTHWRVGAPWAKQGAFKEIVFRKIAEVATRVATLRTGQADIAELTPEVIREVERAKFPIVRSPDSYTPMVTFHGVWLPSRPGYDASLPWLKKEVRLALSLALNRKEIGDKFYLGTASPTAGPHWFHPNTLGWNPAWKPDPYEPARAKKLLGEAGYPNGFTIPLRLFTMPGTTELPALGEAVAGYWEKVGVKAELIRTEWVVHRPDLVKRSFKGATVYRGFPQVEPVTVWRLTYHSKGDFGEREDLAVDSAIDALMLILLFAVTLEWLPAGGTGSLAHLVLPSITLGWFTVAGIMRLVRSAMLDTLGEEFVVTARAKGLAERGVVWKHALRNAVIPPLTYAGVVFVALLAGAVVTETVFAWPGVGQLVIESIAFRDFPVIQIIFLLFGVMYIGMNLVVDLLYAWADPRIRLAESGARQR